MPLLGQYMPASQGSQVAIEVWPVRGLMKPAAHGVIAAEFPGQ
jgi:hypothetical protein